MVLAPHTIGESAAREEPRRWTKDNGARAPRMTIMEELIIFVLDPIYLTITDSIIILVSCQSTITIKNNF
jgi:hypothetical protein